MNYIEVNGLSKSYGKFKAVDNISFSVKKGEIFGLLGPNGAGKTTTIDMVSGILTKDSGDITVLGRDPKKDSEYVKNNMNAATAYLPLTSILTAEQNLIIFAKLFNVKNYKERIKDLFKDFEIEHLAKKKVHSMSSGERTRVSLCKGLINNPKLLLLDECTVGLDPDVAEKTRDIIKNYNKVHSSAILFTSHYMYEVEELCNRIAFMHKGKIIRIDTADRLKKMIKNQTVELTLMKKYPELKQFFKERGVDVIFLDNNAIRFEVNASTYDLPKLLNRLFQQGIKLRDIHVQRPTLDEIFIKISRGKFGEKE